MLSPKIHRYIFLFGVISLGFGMMMGALPTSLPQVILLGNWLLEMDFKRKWQQLKSNKLFWVFTSIFFLHIIGVLYSSNIPSAIDDLKIKMPIFFLPLILFTTKPLTKREFHFALYSFLLGSFVNVAWCYIYNFILHDTYVARDVSRFMSHIRLGLYLNVAVCCAVYFIVIHKKISTRLFFATLGVFFLLAMYKLGLASGIINFLILSFITLCYIMLKQNNLIKLILLAIIVSGVWFTTNYVRKVYTKQFGIKNSHNNILLKMSSSGRAYIHYDTLGQKENGVYVYQNIQPEEILRQWNRRCPDDTFYYHPPVNLNRYEILLRYLSSKDLTKDSLGVWSLSADDLTNIKNDVSNHESVKWSYLYKRVYEMVYEYDEFVNGRNVNGHSLTMRPYFWKAATSLIKQHPLFGVGTGDVQDKMNEAYANIHSPLENKWHKRPHNQFITVTVALGIVGLLTFLLSLFAPYLMVRRYINVLYKPFFVLVIISFLLEDTLESQAGLTFYVVFSTLFLSQSWHKMKGSSESLA